MKRKLLYWCVRVFIALVVYITALLLMLHLTLYVPQTARGAVAIFIAAISGTTFGYFGCVSLYDLAYAYHRRRIRSLTPLEAAAYALAIFDRDAPAILSDEIEPLDTTRHKSEVHFAAIESLLKEPQNDTK